MANIAARRQLDALFMRGVEVRFGTDPETGTPKGKIGPFREADNLPNGEPNPKAGRPIPLREGEIQMMVRPANPVQREQAMREANAKRARALVMAKRHEDSEEHLTIMAFLVDMSDEILIDYVLMSNYGSRMGDAEREILSLDEWKDMTSYQDAARQFEEMDPAELDGNPEWEAFKELDEKYSKQVAEREMEMADAHRDVLKMLPRDQVEKQALDKRAELVGSNAFIGEYEKWMMYFACRDMPDSNQLFYGSCDEFAQADAEIRNTVAEALEPFIGDGAEAKNSQRAASGSDSSVLPETPETSEVSTPEMQSA